ncbi:MAG TPA: M23 family metallopeptidase [Candidatus Limnocylindrales bacterium]|nr:M23 family metallopeptidase [Candidatus Limnocylindrales bacterium]
MRLSGERTVSLTAVGLLVGALAVSNLGLSSSSGPTGNTNGAGDEPRIALGGAVAGVQGTPDPAAIADFAAIDGSVDTAGTGSSNFLADLPPAIDGPFAADGTILKPGSVDTTVSDGKDLMREYRVKPGDTLTGVASRFGVTMMTVWWANHLTSKDALHVGQILVIPPVSGIVVTVGATDTLASLAAKYNVDAADIVDTNELTDPSLVIGQTLTIPGVRAAGITPPAPKPAPKPTTRPTTRPSGGTSRPPSQYTGGRMHWPVAGGYISQYFHPGHGAIDIAAPYGTKVMAAAAGTVIFAGWKDNGGGYQVWIAHGSNLFTTYNHMSAITVGRGQSVARGQQVGRIGMTGDATGPHLHFEVWRGPIWDGGTRVNPLPYL